jgi:hypothetical protein
VSGFATQGSPWAYIRAILGPGFHWGRSVQELEAAIKRAELDGQAAAADHLKVILDLRNKVAFDQ